MNILIIIVGVVVGLIAVLLMIAAFTKKDYSIQRNILINKSVGEVFHYIKHLKNQDHYSTWVMTDPNMKKSYTGTDGTTGFIYAWDGNKQAGQGEQEIVKLEDGKRMDLEIRFIRPFAGIAQTPFITESTSPDQTKLTWGMSSSMKYPMNIMLLFMNMDNLLGKDLETSLSNLKRVLER
jgi:hypothetical protein